MGRKRLGVVARSFTIETRQSDLIDKLADRGNKPASHIVRMALVQYLAGYMDTWECLVCHSHNDNKFDKCWNCNCDKDYQSITTPDILLKMRKKYKDGQ
tara:strand:- start:43 stop:339 length:297 start_codon:yes stop_codon:yes gene_type:complete